MFLLFVVLGPFGLPLLWKSPAVSRTTKIVLTIAVVVYTALLAETAIMAIRMMVEQLELASWGCRAACAVGGRAGMRPSRPRPCRRIRSSRVPRLPRQLGWPRHAGRACHQALHPRVRS